MPSNVRPTSKQNATELFLYGTTNEDKAWLKQVGRKNGRWGNNPETHLLNDFEHLLTLLHTEEYEDSIAYKEAIKAGENIAPPRTKLDIIKDVWNDLLPHRQLIIKAGVIDVKIPNTEIVYNASSMSDGERVILHNIGEVLCAPKNALVIIDEPENHVHKAVQAKLWNSLETLRPDCTFIYLTHDIDFAVSRSNGLKIWVSNYAGEAWEYQLIDNEEHLPEHVFLELLGSHKDITFIEGDKSSIDFQLYKLVFPERTIYPVGSCSKVLEATKAFNTLTPMHRLNSRGIIDRDRRTNAEIGVLRDGVVFIPEVAEVENFFLLEAVVKAVAEAMHRDPNAVFAAVKTNIIDFFQQELVAQVLLNVQHRLSAIARKGFGGTYQNIGEVEAAKANLNQQLDVNALYNQVDGEFNALIVNGDYNGILAVFNNKGILHRSQLASLCGLQSNNLRQFVTDQIKHQTPIGPAISTTIKNSIL